MATAFTFPGQGSQAVGMGKLLSESFPAAKAVFDEVDAALSQKLSQIMWEGPQETLTLTENAQPALMAVSVAVVRVLEAEAGLDLARDVKFVAGHSLGEYSALAAVGAFSITDTAKLLKIRGQAMQKAVPVGTGAMAALLGVELDAAKALAAEAAQGEVCDVANDNGGGQVVVSGSKAAVERAAEIAKGKSIRAMMLPVSAPFHCALMQPAADAMRDALSKVQVNKPKVPGGRERLRKCRDRSQRNHRSTGEAGDRHRALARMRAISRGQWRHQDCRSGLRQSAHRALEAHRERRAGPGDRHPG